MSRLLIFPALLLGSCLAGAGRMEATEKAEVRDLPARDAHFLYEGRFDRAEPAAPVVIWAGSRIRLDFSGTRLAVLWGAADGQNFFNIQVDDATEVAEVPAGSGGRYIWPHPLAAGRHRLVLFKRSEAAAGTVHFSGVELDPEGRAWTPAAPAYLLRMEFIGDSITVGACNEDGAADQWKDRRTHNHALSYAALTSAALGADHRSTAVSGMGVVTGWVEVKAREVWNRVYPRADSPRADLESWQPDVVLINLGENDDSFSRAHGQPFPPGFKAAYVALVRAVRAGWPGARIVLLRGGMYGGSQSVPLREAWAAAVQELEDSDPAVSHFVFTHWSSLHPRVADDQAMADELVAWLEGQAFMRRYQR